MKQFFHPSILKACTFPPSLQAKMAGISKLVNEESVSSLKPRKHILMKIEPHLETFWIYSGAVKVGIQY